MDLGKTALGNWKAQQGGCTHIQVRLHVLHIFASPPPLLRIISKMEGSLYPPSYSFSTKSMTSSK